MKQYESIWPNKTIMDYLNEAIEKDPDKVAIIEERVVTRISELGKMVDRVALGLLNWD